MPNLFATKVKIIYKDREGGEHKVVKRIWEKKDENGHYYVTGIQMSYSDREFAIPIENIHNRVIHPEWEFVRKEVDYTRQVAKSLTRGLVYNHDSEVEIIR